jgi:hypothetical protein
MRFVRLYAALIAAGLALPVSAEPVTLEKLLERLEKLEARNAQLEQEVRALKTENEQISKGLESEGISQYEPDLTSRLKAVEKDVLDMKKPAGLAEALDGIKVDAALTTIVQRASGLPRGVEDAGSQLNYRADVSVEIPLEAIGDIEHKLFAHVRVGQGEGLNAPFGNLGHFNVPNAAAFRASGANADDSVAILGQAWYQAAIPLPLGGFRPHSRETLELTFGKMDIFGFFDQNDVAGDESTQFLNAMFVHNPLLDAGGEVGVDANGFQPGLVVSYVNATNATEPWRLSLGAFGAGEKSSSYRDSGDTPLFIAQAEKTLRLFGGLTGNYRAYAWTRTKVPHFSEATTHRHSGFGVSIDQSVSDGVRLFGRYGQLTRGDLPFEKTLTLGAEINGGYWGRAGDAVGVGGSWQKSSAAYRRAGGEGYLGNDSLENGRPDFSFTPAGAEKVAEIYYRYRISPQVEISPDFQWIHRPGANPDAGSVKVWGLRANIAY